MTILQLITKTKTLVASSTITAATNASPIAVTTSAAHGLETGDIVVIAGAVGNTAANGQFTVTVVDATHYTLNGSSGNGAWTSGGTATHVGFSLPSFTTDNTVFPQNSDFTVKTRIAALSANTGVTFHYSDSSDSGATFRPGPFYSRYGYLNKTNDALMSWKREDWPQAKLGNPGDCLRLNVYLEGQYGAMATVGSSVSFQAWVEF